MQPTFSFSSTRILTALAIAGAFLIQATTYGGVLAKRGFSERELVGFEQLQTLSKQQTRDVQGGGGDGLLNPKTLLLVAVLVGVGIWAADGFEGSDDECIINGVKIDSNSKECKQAAHLAASE